MLEICAAALCFYIFVVHTFTTQKPFLNPALFLNRNFVLGMSLTLVFGLLNFTPMTLQKGGISDIPSGDVDVELGHHPA